MGVICIDLCWQWDTNGAFAGADCTVIDNIVNHRLEILTLQQIFFHLDSISLNNYLQLLEKWALVAEIVDI